LQDRKVFPITAMNTIQRGLPDRRELRKAERSKDMEKKVGQIC